MENNYVPKFHLNLNFFLEISCPCMHAYELRAKIVLIGLINGNCKISNYSHLNM